MNTKDKAKRFKSIKIFDGLFLYSDPKNSPNYQVRIRLPQLKKHHVKSSGTSNLVEAKEFAKDYYQIFLKKNSLEKVPEESTLKFWCKKYYESLQKINPSSDYNTEYNRLLSNTTGICSIYGNTNVKNFTYQTVISFFEKRDKQSAEDNKPLLTVGTKNKYISLFRSLLRFIVRENGLDKLPELLPFRVKNKSNPRSSFKFDEPNNEYKKLLKTIRECIKAKEVVRYNTITEDLYTLVMFIVHGFLRPTVSEVFAIRYQDLKAINETKTKTVQIQINKGKTGFRISNSTETLLDHFLKMKKKETAYKDNDYVIGAEYPNRKTFSRMMMRQFNHVLEKADLLEDEHGQKRSLYSLRHLAIQMRLVKSGGKINLLWFAKNCGTSVDMIERFYARYLPNSEQVIKNLQSFADR